MIRYKQIKCALYEVPKTGNYHFIDLFDDQHWYVDGKLHRDNDQPAIILFDGTQYWYQNGKQHRFNNPAVIYFNGSAEFWYEGKQYSKQEYFALMLDKGLISEKEYFAKLL